MKDTQVEDTSLEEVWKCQTIEGPVHILKS